MNLRERIITFINQSAMRRKTDQRKPFLLGGGLFMTGLAGIVILAFLTDRILSLPRVPSHPMNLLMGVILLVIGSWLWIWSVATFAVMKGTPVPLAPPPVLVVRGPYRFSRNPMLTGVFFTLFGIGFLLPSLSLVFIYTPAFILLNYFWLKYIEEPELERRLGAAYVDYKKHTPMFFGRRGE